MSALISLAASAERWARARTSEATTAKPRPASPARAASTPAFSARRLVWKAISSITLMIWLISLADCSMRPMAPTASRTTWPERSASPLATDTTDWAWLAPSAVRRTVAVIWSSAAAVSSRLAACCSVRRDRSSAACEISPAPERMPWVLWAITFMVSCRRLMAPLKSARSFSYSSGKVVFRRKVTSPSARRSRPSARLFTTAC